MHPAVKTFLIVFLMTTVSGNVSKDGNSLTRVGRLVDEAVALKELYMEQLRSSASTEETRQHILTEIKDRQNARMLLEEEVMQIEAQATEQQQMARNALEEAAKKARNLRGKLLDGYDAIKHASDEADVASRQLCEVLTEDYGDLRLLCRQATHNPSPEFAKLLKWLEAKIIRETEGDHKTCPTLTMTLLKVLLVCGAWAAMAWVLVPRKKVLKME